MENNLNASKREKLESKRSISKMTTVRNITRAFTNFMESKNENPIFKKVMLGNFEDCPSIGTKIIRIFLSSTFSDMTAERNVIMKSVYPRLKKYCREKYGIEFQILDMRWGVPTDSELDHQGPQLCYQEILNCQQSSCSLNFIAMIGHRYGSTNPPFQISDVQFSNILEVLQEFGICSRVLQDWYEVDTNSVPPVYTLRPIPAPCAEPTLDEVRTARAQWNNTEKQITDKLATASEILTKRGIFTEKERKKFYSSVTDQEIEIGICSEESSTKSVKVAAFIRNISDIDEHIQNSNAKKFIDLKVFEQSTIENVNYCIDQTMNHIMKKLIHNSIKDCVNPSRICELEVSWNEMFQQTDNPYLHQFKNRFFSVVKEIIDEDLDRNIGTGDEELYNETLQHTIACVQHARHFQGRSELLDAVQAYLDNSSDKPLVVYGESGSGKTSIMAKSAFSCRSHLSLEERLNAVVLLRFLGTTPGTSNIRNTFKYLSRQLATFTGDDDEVAQIDDFQESVQKFYQMVNHLAEFRRVIIFIDSIDQLQPSDGAYTLSWLQTPLHPNVHMVLSTLPNHDGILDNLRIKLEDPRHFVEVTHLNQSTCMDILMSILHEKGRTITTQQADILRHAFTQCSLPIYVDLLHRTVFHWRSHHIDETAELALRYTVREAVFQFFGNMEKKHNKTFVRHALAFITASRNGLSEAELEDIMSLDDKLLQNVFVHHIPPQIRMPPFLWSRLRGDIGSYLVEREADNVRVLYWYHRQFIEVAYEYFLSDDQFRIYIHDTLADYFLGTYASGKTKRFYYPDYIAKKRNLGAYSDEDRGVIAQPLKFVTSKANSDSKVVFYNLRKINELPWHLCKSGRHAEFADHVAFNYDFLVHKIRSSSRSSLLEDLALVRDLDTSYKASIEALYNAIRLASLSLSHDSSNLAFDLIGRLTMLDQSPEPRSHINPNQQRITESCGQYWRVSELLRQARVQSHHDIGYIPVGQSLDSGSGLVYLCFDAGLAMGIVLANNQILLISMVDRAVSFYDVEGNFLRRVETRFNVFMAMKFFFMRRLQEGNTTRICLLNITETPDGVVTEDKGNEEDDDDETKINRKIFVEFNFFNGKITEIAEVGENLRNFKDADFFDIGDRFVQLDSRIGRGGLARLSDQKIIYEKLEGVIHTHLSIEEKYSVILFTKVKRTYIKIYNLDEETAPLKFGIPGYLTPITVFIMDSQMMVFFRRNDIIYFHKYEIQKECIIDCREVLSHKLYYNPVRAREFYKLSSSFIVFTMQQKNAELSKQIDNSIHGFIYNYRVHSIVPLHIPQSLAHYRYCTDTFGESVQCDFANTDDLLLTTGTKCLVMSWSALTGQLLRVITLGSAESILSGVFCGSLNKIAICHFCDETDKNIDDRLYILVKVFNIDELRIPDILITNNTRSSSNQEDNEVNHQSKLTYIDPVPFQKTKNTYVNCTDVLDGLLYVGNKNCTDPCILIDGYENCTMQLSASKLRYLHLSILDSSTANDDLLLRIDYVNEGISKLMQLNKQNESCEFVSCFNTDNGLVSKTNNIKLFQNNHNVKEFPGTFQYMFNDIFEGWFLFFKLDHFTLSYKTLHKDKGCQFNGEHCFEIPDEKHSFESFQRRFNFKNQFVLFYKKDVKLSLLEHLKGEKSEIVWNGYMIVFEMNLIMDEANEEKLDINVICAGESDIGDRCCLISQDQAVNYKLETIDINTGTKTGQVLVENSGLDYVIYPTIIVDAAFVICVKVTCPITITFDMGIDDDDSSQSEMFTLLPMRSLCMIDVEKKKVVASYPFENEIDYFLVFRNTNYFCVITINEPIRILRVNYETKFDYLLPDLRFKREQTISRNFIDLKETLSKALQEVLNQRPTDPILFISNFLRSN